MEPLQELPQSADEVELSLKLGEPGGTGFSRHARRKGTKRARGESKNMLLKPLDEHAGLIRNFDAI